MSASTIIAPCTIIQFLMKMTPYTIIVPSMINQQFRVPINWIWQFDCVSNIRKLWFFSSFYSFCQVKAIGAVLKLNSWCHQKMLMAYLCRHLAESLLYLSGFFELSNQITKYLRAKFKEIVLIDVGDGDVKDIFSVNESGWICWKWSESSLEHNRSIHS